MAQRFHVWCGGVLAVWATVLAWMTLLSGAALAQPCVPGWRAVAEVGLSGFAAGTNGRVFAMGRWDPDGAGPLAARLVVGGSFTLAGTTAANSIAMFDAVSGRWLAMGGGTGGTVGGGMLFDGDLGGVYALANLPNGDLIAAGAFSHAGGVAANSIARWNGTAWAPLGTGITHTSMNVVVAALLVTPTGDVFAGGQFNRAGGVVAPSIARWNGSQWFGVGGGTNGNVYALTRRSDGFVYAGGTFTAVGGVGGTGVGSEPASRVAFWTGSKWMPMNIGMNGPVFALATLSNNVLVAGGQFTEAGFSPVASVAFWTEDDWSPLGDAEFESFRFVSSLWPRSNGRVLAGGEYVDIGFATSRVVEWNGAVWTPLKPGPGDDGSGSGGGGGGGGVATVYELPGGPVYAGGEFEIAGFSDAANIAKWDGFGWSEVSAGSGASVLALTSTSAGRAVAGGTFATGGVPATTGLAQFDGQDWVAMGGAPDGPVHALLRRSNGEIIAGGAFKRIGGVPAVGIARWNGNAWSAMGAGAAGGQATVYALAQTVGGDVIAGGSFTSMGGQPASSIARWNNSAWSGIGGGVPGANSVVYALAARNNEIIVGGSFSSAGGTTALNVARVVGSAWQTMGLGFNGAVRALTFASDGSVIAGGGFTASGLSSVLRVARWTGSAWQGMGGGLEGTVLALATLPDGGVVAGGAISGAPIGGGTVVPLGRLAVWDGVRWGPLGFGMNGEVRALHVTGAGELLAGGVFTSGGGVSSNFVLSLPDCGSLPSGLRSGNITVSGFPDPVTPGPSSGSERSASGGGQTGGGLSDSVMSAAINGQSSMQLRFEGQALHFRFDGYTGSGTDQRGDPLVLELVFDADFTVNNQSSATAGGSPIGYTPVILTGLTGTITGDQRVSGRMTKGLYLVENGVVAGRYSDFAFTGFQRFYAIDPVNPPSFIDSSTANWTMTLTFDVPCPGDFSGDGFVDDTDFVTFAAAYEGFTIPPADARADLTGDGFVDDSDFVIFAAGYEAFACP